ncbi:AMP-binding protein [Corynebacterium variabile]|uniref:AMP-binding protein n=1 Tax=Corynebacterium variabile TaxID=1727 RepID=UPI003A5C84B6
MNSDSAHVRTGVSVSTTPSRFPEIVIPDETIYQTLFGSLTEDQRARPAITDSATGQEVSYGELQDMVDATAGALAARGVGKGSVVGLHAPNSLAFAVAFHGIMRAGGTVTTLGSLLIPSDIDKQLQQAGASHLLTMKALGDAGITGAASAGLPAESVIVLDDPEAGQASLIAEGRPAPEVDLDPATDIAVIPFSSGTTGMAKGVKLSHRNLVANMYQIGVTLEVSGVDHDWTMLAVLPFFHIYGMNSLLNASLLHRMHLVTMPTFDLVKFLAAIEKYRVDLTYIAPPIAVALAKHPVVAEYDLSSMKHMVSGAAALDGDLADSVSGRIGSTVAQGYGMTETSPVTHCAVLGETPAASIGHPVSNTEAKVVDVSDDSLLEITAPDSDDPEVRSKSGELWIRGPQVMVGYLDNEEATARTITPEGWLRTGDIVDLDRDGNVYVVDRMKELIKYKGYQVAPAELEALLLSHPDIADAGVVGVLRESDGEEVPRAFIVPQVREGSPVKVDAEELMGWVAEQVTPYKKIRYVDIVEAIPKSNTGKILRKDLKAVPLQVTA